MAKKITGIVKLQISAGKATPAPPVGSVLGPHGINIAGFCKEFNERTAKDDDALVSLQLVNEMLQRGCQFLPIELGKSYASKYVVEDGKVRLPFTAIRGLGEAAAVALEQATIHGQEYISVEELQQASGVAQSVFDKLHEVGALGNLPETSQVDLFSLM